MVGVVERCWLDLKQMNLEYELNNGNDQPNQTTTTKHTEKKMVLTKTQSGSQTNPLLVS